MLGKGLESLIPPQKNNGSGNGDEGNSVPFDPHISEPPNPTFQFMPHDEPEPELPPNIPQVHPPQPEHTRPTPPPYIPKAEEKRTSPTPSDEKAKRERSEPQKKNQEDYIFHIEVDKIKPNPSQPRRHFAEAAVKELAYSIREFGFL